MKDQIIRFANLPGVGITLFCAALIFVTVSAFVMIALVISF